MFLPVISPCAAALGGFAFDGGAFDGWRVGAMVERGRGRPETPPTMLPLAAGNGAFGVAADQVHHARGRRTELVVEGVVVQRVVLSVVPQCSHGVAVVVIHDDAVRTVVIFVFFGRLRAVAGTLGLLDKHVHFPVVLGFLLRRVAVVLIAGHALRPGRGASG